MIDLTSILQAIISLMAVLTTAFFIPWLKKRLMAEKREELVEWVNIAVTAAEQLAKLHGWGGEHKKQYVLSFLETKGYVIDTNNMKDAINALIEAVVYELKD